MRDWPEISVELGKVHERLAGNRFGIGGKPMRDWPEISVKLSGYWSGRRSREFSGAAEAAERGNYATICGGIFST